MIRLFILIKVILLLGVRNTWRVGLHRIKLKVGWRPKPMKVPYPGGLIMQTGHGNSVDKDLNNSFSCFAFGWYPLKLIDPPNWHADVFGLSEILHPKEDWVSYLRADSRIDVKRYWELSRFYWLPQLALAAQDGDQSATVKIETWLADWVSKNPTYSGINWACGQESAIRLMNLALCSLILNSWEKPSAALKWIVEAHATRIYQTFSYALGQDNNHGTVEACALYIAGTWGKSWSMSGADKFARRGRKWLNERALRVIQIDGSPCQYSTNYHRVNLEAFCMAEIWSTRTGNPGLNAHAAKRIVKGARWLYSITDPNHGDAPNLGANDSAHLFSVPLASYRDFRPTIALVAAIFDDSQPWRGYHDARLEALDLSPGSKHWECVASTSYDAGGFHVLRTKKTCVMMNYPRFKFRPSQADALNIDIWHDGINLVRDAGSYSYALATEAEWFSGTNAHNTIQFDERDQMPRLGKFLYGNWLRAHGLEFVNENKGIIRAGAGYIDSYGSAHYRSIELTNSSFICTDSVSGEFNEACLRWRLAPLDWDLKDNMLSAGTVSIAIEIDGIPVTPNCNSTFESKFYMHKTEIPEISAKTLSPSTIITRITF